MAGYERDREVRWDRRGGGEEGIISRQIKLKHAPKSMIT